MTIFKNLQDVPGSFSGECIIETLGNCWITNGQLHRNDGPAVIDPDTRMYFNHGALHRLDGPAIEYCDRYSLKDIYYIDGILITDQRKFTIMGMRWKLKNIINSQLE